MGLSITPPSLFLLFIFILISSSSSSSDFTNLIFKGCANQKFPDQSGSISLKSLYAALISQSSAANFYKTTAGGNPGNDQSTTTSITGLFQCRGDLSAADCNTCVKKLPDIIGKVCGGDTVAARAQLGGCYMRYEIVGFQQASSTDTLFKKCGSNRASGSGFDERLAAALGQIEKGVADGKGHYAGGYQSVYVLGQCEGDLGNGECVNCVKTAAATAINECGSSISGQIYLQQCYISYHYYPDGVPRSGGGGGAGIETGATETGGGGGGGGGGKTQKTIAIVFGGVAGLGLVVAFLLVIKSAFRKKKDKYSYGGY